MPLGPHCTDHSCAMYEVVDIVAPPKDEGYLQLGNDCVYDAGMANICKGYGLIGFVPNAVTTS